MKGCVNAKWMARISFKGKPLTLGFYHTEEAAALAYNRAVEEMNLNRVKNII